MKTIKSIDGKSMLIGCLLACTIFFAMGATDAPNKWDDKQQWETGTIRSRDGMFRLFPDKDYNDEIIQNRFSDHKEWPVGWEPLTCRTANGQTDERSIKAGVWLVRKRIK